MTPDEALATHTIVLFDGVCSFCDRTTQFLLKHDTSDRFRFTPLQSDATDALRRDYAIPHTAQSVAVIDRGELLLRTDALLRIAWRLGGWWRLWSLFIIVPRFLRDAAYLLFARSRYRLFGERTHCVVPTAEHEARFLIPPDPNAPKGPPPLPLRSRRKKLSRLLRLLPEGSRDVLMAYREGQRIAPPMSWIVHTVDVIRALLFQFERWRVGQRAAGVAFFLLIGFVPMIMMLVVATELVGMTAVVGEFLVDAIIQNYLPIERERAMETIGEWVNNARTTIAGGLGFIGLIFAALNAFGGLYSLVNDLWQVPARGRFAHRLKSAALMVLVVPAALFASTWLTARVGGLLWIGALAGRVVAYLLIFVLAALGLRIIARAKVRWRYAFIAAALGAFAFEVAKTVFAFYVSAMLQGTWFAIYGIIFLFPVFLLWNLVTANIIAATASIAWILQNPGEAFYDAGIATPQSMNLHGPRVRTYDPVTGRFYLSVISPDEDEAPAPDDSDGSSGETGEDELPSGESP